ncbi:MAG: hypothetical protein WBE08_08850 [Methyloceanibacter sp.]
MFMVDAAFCGVVVGGLLRDLRRRLGRPFGHCSLWCQLLTLSDGRYDYASSDLRPYPERGKIVIFESWFWKRELFGHLSAFIAWGPKQIAEYRKDKWGGESCFQLERSIFYAALAMRRLIDSHKVTDALRTRTSRLPIYRSLKEGPHTARSILGSVDILEHFDFANPESEAFSPYKLSSEILHSFTFEFISNDAEDDISSILVASEKNQFSRAVEIGKDQWIALLNAFIEDEVEEMMIFSKGDRAIPRIEIK